MACYRDSFTFLFFGKMMLGKNVISQTYEGTSPKRKKKK
jgi:hypothetical protein